ncbi:MAG: hypothetical protein PUC90_07990 [Prevotella sp.]|nr:hypothetical protein [Prevotella sp.]
MTKKETKFIQKYLEYYGTYGDDIPTDSWNFLSRYRKSLGIDYQRSKILIEEAVRSYEESNNEKISDPKIKTKRDYNEISAQLRAAIKQIQKIPSSTNEFQKIKQSFVDTLSAQLSRTHLEANNALNSTEWDKLVIAFFGETNAGKSTIIETFRILFDETERHKNIHASFFKRLKNAYYEIPREGHSRAYEIFIECIKLFDVRKWFRHIEYAVDGIIVGDGRHDFTKIYKEYEMNISGKPFVLIDVPGIEGNEDDYKDEIKIALSKAHCVFYVQGHNKTTDSATAEKIKKYLRNWVKVYTIYNVRGSADAYDTPEERVNLVTDDVRKVCVGIEKSFSDILGDSYGGNTVTQGFLALSAQANFSPKRADLIRKQNKLLTFFNSRDELYQFSRFDSVVSLVNEKASNYTNEIYEANKDKLVALSKHTIFAIEEELNNQKGTIEKYCGLLNNYRREVDTYYNSASHRIEIQLREKCDDEFRKLKESVFTIISDDEPEKKERIAGQVNTTSGSLREGIFHILKTENEELNKRLKESERKLKGLPIGILNFEHLNNESPNIYININDFLEHLEISFGDVFNFGMNVAGSAAAGATLGSFIPGIGNLVGGIIGGFLGAAKSLFTSDGGVGKAQEEARKKIDEASFRAWDDIQKNVVYKIKNDFNKQTTKTSAVVNDALSNISKLDSAINEAKKRILDFENKMKTEQYGSVKE